MIKVFFAEWRKLRRPTLLFGTFISALFFNGLITSFIYLMIDSPDGNADRGRSVGREVLGLASGSVNGFASIGGLLGIIALCVFAAQSAQEYTYGTLRNLLVRQPRRLVLLAGKYSAMAAFALILTIINAIVSLQLQYKHNCLIERGSQPISGLHTRVGLPLATRWSMSIFQLSSMRSSESVWEFFYGRQSLQFRLRWYGFLSWRT